MKNNFLDLPVLNMVALFIVLGMSVGFPFIAMYGAQEIINYIGRTNDLQIVVGAAYCLSFVIGIIGTRIFFIIVNNKDFSKVYNVQLIEKESVSEIKYSKKDGFKTGFINNLYINKGKLFIIKDPKSDNYLLSHNKEILEDILTGKYYLSKPYYKTYSKEDVKKTLENSY